MATPQEVKSKHHEAERQAKEGMRKLVHAKELEKAATEAEIRLKEQEAHKAREKLEKERRDLEKTRASLHHS